MDQISVLLPNSLFQLCNMMCLALPLILFVGAVVYVRRSSKSSRATDDE